MTTIDRLRNGECLCAQCGTIQKPLAAVRYSFGEYLTCPEGCEYENGNAVRVITWLDVREGLPHSSQKEINWLAGNCPEVLREAEREAA